MKKEENPYNSAMGVFGAHIAGSGESQSPEVMDAALAAAKAAIKVAIVAERARCIALCDKNMDEYESESNTSGVLPDVYIRGYKDGSEDCMYRMKSLDGSDLADHDAAVAKVAVAFEKKPSPYLIDILANDEEGAPKFEQEGDEEEVCL